MLFMTSMHMNLILFMTNILGVVKYMVNNRLFSSVMVNNRLFSSVMIFHCETALESDLNTCSCKMVEVII